jgi:molybdenum cofactor cytidylyltransferase
MPDRMPPSVAIVLAAGAGRRFGATKQLVELDGKPLVAHAVDVARRAGIADVLVVVGHDADDVRGAVGDRARVVDNPDHARGQSTSLVKGLEAAGRTDAEVAVILLADQPRVDPALVRATAMLAAGGEAVRARYLDGPGHPVALARAVWGRVSERVTGDAGARQMLDELSVVELEVDGPAPVDVDDPGDLGRLGRGK